MFGVPPFTYHAYKFPEDKHPHESRESFEANIGGRGGLPTYTTALTQMFFTNPVSLVTILYKVSVSYVMSFRGWILQWMRVPCKF